MIGPPTLTIRPFPGPDRSDVPEGYIKTELFRDVERIMAQRVKARTTEVAGASHAVMISRPAATARVILAAAKTVR
jgi:pimeloyl-ACP methyl ester carboxylesterase